MVGVGVWGGEGGGGRAANNEVTTPRVEIVRVTTAVDVSIAFLLFCADPP